MRQVATDRLEASGVQSSGTHMDLSEWAGVPQSTPKKSKDNSAEQSTSSLPSALTLSLTSPESAVVRPRTQPTLSGRYLARPPTWKLQEVLGATSASWIRPHSAPEDISPEDEDDPLHEMSTSFGEFGLDDPADDSFEPLSDTSPSSPGSCSGSTSSKGSGDSSADRRWLVDEAKLMELFKTCRQCGTAIEEQTTTQHGSKIKMYCFRTES
ncbi:unnamed protein product [Arctogadus glacialis]